MLNVIIDIEADGAIIGKHSMISFGAVIVDKKRDLKKTFYRELKPIGEDYNPEALAVSGFSREETLKFEEPAVVMKEFFDWINSHGEDRAKLFSDNAGYDASWINWYFLTYVGKNPFGWTSEDISSLFKGVKGNMKASFKPLRKSAHTHNALDDAMGNAEAILAIEKKFKMNFFL